jgi:lysophospholipase L1-like esterase
LKSAGVSHEQVQVAWIKLANARPSGELHEHGKELEQDTRTVLANLTKHFPNLRIAYLGSRIYGGYADGELNPEPYAYEGAFVVRWLIQNQTNADTELNDDVAQAEVNSPLLLWGPYLWSDGMTPRKSDGQIWQRSDLVNDGTHPSDSGRQKVADQLLDFFKTDPDTQTWFVKK